MRLRLVKQGTNFDFFARWKLWLGISAVLVVVGMASFAIQGLNFGIDFKGGTTIRLDTKIETDVAAYRDAIAPLDLGDVVITTVTDPTFRADQFVSQIRIQSQADEEAISSGTVSDVRSALGEKFGGTLSFVVFGLSRDRVAADLAAFANAQTVISDNDVTVTLPVGSSILEAETMKLAIRGAVSKSLPEYELLTFASVESVGPKVSGELIKTAALAVIAAIGAVLIYIWLRFEWQFALGAVLALVHDVVLTIGIFSELQIRFDLAIIAALLTIVGYSLNDTVVVFDRVRENLRKYKKKPLYEVLNLSINETLSRTFMTSVTTLLALISLFVLGGDVIRGFVFAMIWGVIIGTYSSIFVASSALLFLGVKRNWDKPDNTEGNQFANIDA